MNMQYSNKTLLLLIDLQNAIDHPSWGERNNPDAEENITKLLGHWRDQKMPIIHIKHMSINADSHYRPNQHGNDFKTFALPLDNEEVIEKNSNSAFIGTNLEERLHEEKINQVVIVGVITNNSVEATARMSGNLGFDTFVVSDAIYTFGMCDYLGNNYDADVIHNISLANLDGEYAQIVQTNELID